MLLYGGEVEFMGAVWVSPFIQVLAACVRARARVRVWRGGWVFRVLLETLGSSAHPFQKSVEGPSQGQNVRTVEMESTHFCMFPHSLEWDPRLQETHL